MIRILFVTARLSIETSILRLLAMPQTALQWQAKQMSFTYISQAKCNQCAAM